VVSSYYTTTGIPDHLLKVEGALVFVDLRRIADDPTQPKGPRYVQSLQHVCRQDSTVVSHVFFRKTS
jgi:hypothetical protein